MATTGPALSPREQTVTIYVDARGNYLRVSGDFKISKSQHQEVVWQTSPPDFPFTVLFQQGPFCYQDFDRDDPYSGEVKREIEPPKGGIYYKYTVTAGNGGEDPGGTVNP